MVQDSRTVRPVVRLAIMAGMVLLPFVAVLAYSYALLAGSLVLVVGWLGVVHFWKRIARERSAPQQGARWRMSVWGFAILFVASNSVLVALRLSEWPGDPAAPDWPGALTGTLIGMSIVSGFLGLAILALARYRTGFPFPVALAAAVMLVGVPFYTVMSLDFPRPAPVGRSVLSPEVDYLGEVALEADGGWVGSQRFEIRPHGHREESGIGGYLLEAVDEEWSDARTLDGVAVKSGRTPPLLGPDANPAGLSVSLRGPVGLDTRRLGFLCRVVRVEPIDPPIRIFLLEPWTLKIVGVRIRSTYPVWGVGSFERSRLQVRLPRNAFLISSPGGELSEIDGEDRLGVDLPWPPPLLYVRREPFRPFVEVVYLPALRFAWLRNALQAALGSPRAVALFAFLIWPSGLAIFIASKRGSGARPSPPPTGTSV